MNYLLMSARGSAMKESAKISGTAEEIELFIVTAATRNVTVAGVCAHDQND